MAVERAAAGISVVDIAFRVERKALFGPGNATTDLLYADKWHVSSVPDKECDGGRCDDSGEGESGDLKAPGDAHCEKSSLSFLLVEKR